MKLSFFKILLFSLLLTSINAAAQSVGQSWSSPITASSIEVIHDCKCDDVNGDSSALVTYMESYKQEVNTDTVITEMLGVFVDKKMLATYTPINPVDCDLGGRDAVIEFKTETITNGTWTSPAMTTSIAYSIFDLGAGVTVDDGEGPEAALPNQSGSWGNEDYNIINNTVSITATNAIVVINYKILK